MAMAMARQEGERVDAIVKVSVPRTRRDALLARYTVIEIRLSGLSRPVSLSSETLRHRPVDVHITGERLSEEVDVVVRSVHGVTAAQERELLYSGEGK